MTNANTNETVVTNDVAVQEALAASLASADRRGNYEDHITPEDTEVSFQTEAEVGGEPVAVTVH